ncbi:MAG: alpha/beta hydrolase-fold protein [Myxococcales bacterium]|nr:alpha/beta hydrolase-fold protein [Polyangiaceae bacterium]MDW8249548.1 alpha/beta hydrolase-fold protein [Myxococcales bacterium]
MEVNVPRRSLLLATLAACSRQSSPVASQAPQGYDLHDWSFSGSAGGSERVVVLVPQGAGPYPVLMALHGRGEAVRGAEVGAYAWLRDYRIGEALAALHRGKLTEEDFARLAVPSRLSELNRGLSKVPFGGMILVFPHAPDFPGATREELTDRYGVWLLEVLLGRLHTSFPGVSSVGIDGVSMGGRMALRIGLQHPEVFATVGSLQAAIRPEDASRLVEMARRYRQVRPGGRLRLLTSEGDFFREAILEAHRALQQASIHHEFLEVAGPHNYQFNRGPGAIEMLLWHDRALRGVG